MHGGGAATTYQANSLNQYTSIQSPGSRWILGEAPPSDAVTINGVAADRAGAFFSKQLTDPNTSPLWSENTIASNGVTVSGHLWTPAASFVPSYDPDGNLLSDGRWVYTWDGENRLIRMETTTAAASAGVPRQRLDFAYDAKHRRVSKTVWSSSDGSNWTFTSNRRFLYDGWNLIAEYTAPSASSSNLSLDAAYTWGTDLSGTAQGAGGVGGLLSVSLTSHPSPLIPTYDGNGNISAWMGSAGELLEKRDYTPFGGLLMRRKSAGATDVLSKLRFGFSTKYEDPETGLLYYGYRYYDPVTGRWPSRDPIEEEGGKNVYTFTKNNPIILFDVLGLKIEEYNLDVNSLPLVPTRLGAGTGGEEDGIWTSKAVVSLTTAAYFGIGENEQLKLTGGLEIKLRIQIGYSENDLALDGWPIGIHERYHAQVDKNYFNQFAKLANKYEGKYCKGCGDRAKEIVQALHYRFESEANMVNGLFDESQYGKPISQKRFKDLRESEQKLQKAFKEYFKLGCRKL